jgi:hypothetical protein
MEDSEAHDRLRAVYPEYKGNTLLDAEEFIKDKFMELARCNRPRTEAADINVHLTQATDTQMVSQVFDTVKEVVLKLNLEAVGVHI